MFELYQGSSGLSDVKLGRFPPRVRWNPDMHGRSQTFFSWIKFQKW
jgi:hypothetical protein